jgi:hypothetical protein
MASTDSVRHAIEGYLTQASTGKFTALPPHVYPTPADAPAALREALATLDTLPDWLDLVAHLCSVTTPAGPVWLYLIGFELSKDGWFVAVGAEGTQYGYGRYDHGTITWSTLEEVVLGLNPRPAPPSFVMTWSQNPDGVHVSSCGRFTIEGEPGKWLVRYQGNAYQTLNDLEHAKKLAEASAPPL